MTSYGFFRKDLAFFVSSTDIRAGFQIDTMDPLFVSKQCNQFERSRFFAICVALFMFWVQIEPIKYCSSIKGGSVSTYVHTSQDSGKVFQYYLEERYM